MTNASGGGIDTVISAITYTLGDNLDNLTLTGSADLSGTGNALDNVISGNDGNNTLIGGDGNDTISGGAGNDAINGGSGADAMDGGAGNDSYFVDSLGDTVTETLTNANGGGIDKVTSTVNFTLGDNLDNLTLGGTDGVTGTGNGLDNTIVGNAGDNTLNGAGGNDTITGGDGNDTIDGGVGNDVLHGGNGNDIIFGSAGDTLTGDAGNDAFHLQVGFKSADGGAEIDTAYVEALGSAINLTGALATTLKNIEIIDISGNANNTLTLDAKSVAAMSGGAVGSHTLIVNDDAGDTVNLDSSWKHTGTQTNPSGQIGTYDVYTSGGSTLLVEHHDGGSGPGGGTPVPTLAELDGTNGFQIDGSTTDNRAGGSVATGDFNGDGFDDIILGTQDGLGDGYVLYGHAGGFDKSINLGSLDSTEGFHFINAGKSDGSISSDPPSPYYLSVASAGDVNGDGLTDFIVGSYATSADSHHVSAGSSFVVFGQAGGFSGPLDLSELTAGEGFRIDGAADKFQKSASPLLRRATSTATGSTMLSSVHSSQGGTARLTSRRAQPMSCSVIAARSRRPTSRPWMGAMDSASKVRPEEISSATRWHPRAISTATASMTSSWARRISTIRGHKTHPARPMFYSVTTAISIQRSTPQISILPTASRFRGSPIMIMWASPLPRPATSMATVLPIF